MLSVLHAADTVRLRSLFATAPLLPSVPALQATCHQIESGNMDRHTRPSLQRAPTSGSLHSDHVSRVSREPRNRSTSPMVLSATDLANGNKGPNMRHPSISNDERARHPSRLLQKAYHMHAHMPSTMQKPIHTKTLAITITATAPLATGRPSLD